MKEDVEYRGYFFTNMYLSSIQIGIQTAHCVSELTLNYNYIFNKWARYHKTIIVLNGGNQKSLQDIADNLSHFTKRLNYKSNSLPLAVFREDEQSLNNAITCVGIILPNNIYDFYLDDFDMATDQQVVEQELKEFISLFHLAR